MKIRKEGIKRAVTFILTVVMISLFAVNAFAADSIRCRTYSCKGTEFKDALEDDGMPTSIYLTPTITPDRDSSSGYRVSSVEMFFEIKPDDEKQQTITSLSQVGILYSVGVTYEFPNGWSGYEHYQKWVYYGIFPNQTGTFKSPTVTIDIPEYTNVNYRGTRNISASVEIYTNSTPSVSESGKFYSYFNTVNPIEMSTIVNQNT